MNGTGKSFLAAWLLSLLLGTLGVDRFYLGKIGTGILKLVTIGGFGIWWLVDVIMILAGKTTCANGLPLTGYEDKKKIALLVTIGYYVFSSVIALWFTIWYIDFLSAMYPELFLY